MAVRATGAGGTDIIMRRGFYPYAPKIPFVPGYEVVRRCRGARPRCREPQDRRARRRPHDPRRLRREARPRGGRIRAGPRRRRTMRPPSRSSSTTPPPGRRSTAIAKVKAGDSVLITGANGGVGTAMLELLRPAGARVFGAAAASHFDLVRSFGATTGRGEGGAHRHRRPPPRAGRRRRHDRQSRRPLRRPVDPRHAPWRDRPRYRVLGHPRPRQRVPAQPCRRLPHGPRLWQERGLSSASPSSTRRDPQPFREDLAELLALAKDAPSARASPPACRSLRRARPPR